MDRNTQRRDFKRLGLLSLSARRAWIEISMSFNAVKSWVVALRKESVDRNYIIKITETAPRRSLSARRAWIEIESEIRKLLGDKSLSARRAWIEIACVATATA